MKALIKTDIPEGKKLYSGKVRDLYEIDEEHLLIVSTDRLSAFDHVFKEGIPGKGRILNEISNLWFKNINFIGNHLVETDFSAFPAPYNRYPEQLDGRSAIVKKTQKVEFECIARGYIIGSGWKDYKESGNICGIKLPEGLKLAQKLPQAIFTPSTKADEGHDENISFEFMAKNIGQDLAQQLSEQTLKVFNFGMDTVEKCGIILADTKLEFGMYKGELILIDEALTPDSSRFWDASTYETGFSPQSYDKQFVRDYLETTGWDKNSEPPALPEDIIMKTKAKYEEILKKLKTCME
ncbi:MAG: phosphoribosylaminoimidazolesuccinocarboxamide synthase [Spirochaetes bacterium]|nr:phosphoribosylaminoimidazolesuccinocarboxamide synthase [Spirochaetota bacterium]